MKHRIWPASIALAATAALGLAGCTAGPAPSGPSADGKPTGTLTFAAVFQPTSWDPGLSDPMSSGMDFNLVYDTIVHENSKGKLAPGVAESWSYDSAQTTLTLKVRKGQKFSDGEAEDAAAVAANLKHDQAGGPGAALLSFVTDISAPDATTVVLKLSQPDPSLVQNLAGPVGFLAAPSKIADGSLATTPVGAGPYVLDTANSVPGSDWVFKANPGFYGKVHYASVDHKVMADANAELNALKSGQLDVALLLDLQAASAAQKAGYARTLFAPSTVGVEVFDRDGKVVPALGNVKVRQAINYALDAKAMLNAYLGGTAVGTLTRQVFSNTSDAWDPSLDSAYPYDPAKAKKMIADAGYPNGFSVDMPYFLTWGPGIMDEVKKELGAVGITVNYTQVQPQDMTADLIAGKFPMALGTIGYGAAWDTISQFVGPTAPYNPYKAADKTAEGYAHDYQYATSAAARATAGKALNKYMTDQAWFATFAYGHPSFLSDKTKVTLPAESVVLPPFSEWVPVR